MIFPGYPPTPTGIFWTLWQLGLDHRPLHAGDGIELLQQVANAKNTYPDKCFVLENVETISLQTSHHFGRLRLNLHHLYRL